MWQKRKTPAVFGGSVFLDFLQSILVRIRLLPIDCFHEVQKKNAPSTRKFPGRGGGQAGVLKGGIPTTNKGRGAVLPGADFSRRKPGFLLLIGIRKRILNWGRSCSCSWGQNLQIPTAISLRGVLDGFVLSGGRPGLL